MTAVDHSPGGPKAGPSGIPLPETRLSRAIDSVVVWIGETSSWIWTILIVLIVYQVVQRYVFGLGSIKMEEMQWHLYAVGFMLAMPFTEIRERHVRIDVFAEHWPVRVRLWVELIGIVFFLIPFSVFIAWWSVPYVVHSWEVNEISSAPDGLPFRYVLKAFLVVTFVLLAAAGVSRLSRIVAALRLPARPSAG
jgi:TRAP-type mannitol/chloroaromatic compound transport system permease small subunit